jgi:hypothetical protein
MIASIIELRRFMRLVWARELERRGLRADFEDAFRVDLLIEGSVVVD